MSVYIITAREHGVCKIGFSTDPIYRFGALQVGSFAELKLESVIPATQEEELALHAANADHRVRGEWFKITPAIEKLIAAFPCDYKPKVKGRAATSDWQETETITYNVELFREIRDFCLYHDMAESTFGRLANGDWKLVTQLRQGRELRRKTLARIRNFMETFNAEEAA